MCYSHTTDALPVVHPKHSKRDYQGAQDRSDVEVPQDGPLHKKAKGVQTLPGSIWDPNNVLGVYYNHMQKQNVTIVVEQYNPPVTIHQCCLASTKATNAAGS